VVDPSPTFSEVKRADPLRLRRESAGTSFSADASCNTDRKRQAGDGAENERPWLSTEPDRRIAHGKRRH
jgi:hypothetical protein